MFDKSEKCEYCGGVIGFTGTWFVRCSCGKAEGSNVNLHRSGAFSGRYGKSRTRENQEEQDSPSWDNIIRASEEDF